MKRIELLFIVFVVAFVAILSEGCGGSKAPLQHDTEKEVNFHLPDTSNTNTGDTGLFVDSVDIQEETDSGPVEGGKGWPCKKNEDCISGFCIETPDGMRCTNTCSGDVDCDPGYQCTMVQSYPDVMYVCINQNPRLCLPCKTNDDCNVPYLRKKPLCVAWVPEDPTDLSKGYKDGYGIEGAFCGGGCESNADCPLNYTCRMVIAVDGTKAKQCVLEKGSCGCNKRAEKQGLEGVCYIKNQFGVCGGKHRCTPGGMSECDAPVPQAEVCDGIDNDCDGKTDEDIKGEECKKTNGYGTCIGVTKCVDGKEVCDAREPTQEACNGIDDNCDGRTDEEGAVGCKNYYLDKDGDGWGESGDYKCLCNGDGKYTATKSGDCDDTNKDVHPGAEEVCNGVDDDCDGVADPVGAPGCKEFYRDKDQDGYGDSNSDAKCLCSAKVPYTATKKGDCDDMNPAVHPGATEKCNRGVAIDDDCDGITDPPDSPGCVKYYIDRDHDGYGDDSTPPRCLCRPDEKARYTATEGGDCDDMNPQVNPGVKEVCGDGVDNNCNGAQDEPGARGCKWWYKDDDNDGWGGEGKCLCKPRLPYVVDQGGDCNDENKDIHPGAQEICGNDVDEDCDGDTNDPGALNCHTFYLDKDKDGWGETDKHKCLCKVTGDYTTTKEGDCNDDDPNINPGAKEVCHNNVDENCNGKLDDDGGVGCATYYLDADGDGWGGKVMKCLCNPRAGWVNRTGDCDDGDKNVHPEAKEVCDGKDNDCDLATPGDGEGSEGCKTYYYDGDDDGYGMKGGPSKCLCAPDSKSHFDSLNNGDCDDKNPQVNPGEKEVCNHNGKLIDENCNGVTDEDGAVGCVPFYYDGDQDGKGVLDPTHPVRCLCRADVAHKYTAGNADDCNDNNPKIAKGFPEYCDGLDNNCNGETDEEGAIDGTDYYYDRDQDGFGTGEAKKLCAPDMVHGYTALVGGDCNDNNKDIHPAGSNVLGGSVCGEDGDCDGSYIDRGEECDDGNRKDWDGCTDCKFSEYQVNQIYQGDQTYSDLAALNSSQFVVVWQSTSIDSSNWGIAIRKFDINMKALSGDVRVNKTQFGDQEHPSVGRINGNKVVVVWQSTDGSGWGIFGRILPDDLNLNNATDEFRVNKNTGADQVLARVAGVGSYGWVVAYLSSQSGDNRVMIRRFEGVEAKTDPINPDNQNRSAGNPVVAYLGDNRIVVVWEARISDDDWDIYARVLKLPDLSPDPANPQPFRVNTYHTGYQTRPAVAALKDNGFVIAWNSSDEDGSGLGIIAKWYNGAAIAQSDDIIVNTITKNNQMGPAVTGLADGGFYVVWTNVDPQTSLDVMGRYFDGTGTAHGTEKRLHIYTTGTQTYPQVISIGSTVIPVWVSDTQDTNGKGVFCWPKTIQ